MTSMGRPAAADPLLFDCAAAAGTLAAARDRVDPSIDGRCRTVSNA